MKMSRILLTGIFLLAGVFANAQMHQGMHHSSMKDSSGYVKAPYHHEMMSGNRMGGHMMHQGMMCGMHGMKGKGLHQMHRSMDRLPQVKMVMMMPMMDEMLDLKPQQTKQLIDLKASFMKRKVDMKPAIRKAIAELKKMMEDNASVDEVRSQLMKYYQAKLDIKAEAYGTYQEMRNVLTEEQLSKLQDHHAQCFYFNKKKRYHPMKEKDGRHMMHKHHEMN